MWLINTLGVALIGFIIWWFWLWKPKAVAETGSTSQTIVVKNGVYQPANLVVPVNQKTTLHFLRKDQSPCSSTVILSEWDISAELPLDEEVEVTIEPKETGVFPYTCQMQMYRGEIHVVEVGEEKAK